MQACPLCGFEPMPEDKPCPLCGSVEPASAPARPESDDLPTVGLPDTPPGERGGIVADYGPGDLFLDRYEVVDFLGRGGMGSVYRVKDREGGGDRALKILRPEAADDPEGLDRFRREASILARLAHPAVPRIFASGVHGREPYLVVELVDGTDLKSLVRARGPFPPLEAAAFVATVADALQVAHQAGVVHRDVKPQNVMVAKDGAVKLLDFGIARTVARDMTITKTDATLGTPEYMSPEQLESHRVDARSDLYSLGIVLFELLTGHTPFTGDTPIGIAMKHMSEPAPSPRSIRPEIPAWLERVVLKCLEKDKVRRYQTAEELAQELRRPRGDKTHRRRLATGDTVLEDDAETSDWALVLKSPKKKESWFVGMTLVFAGRYYKLVEAVDTGDGFTYHLSFWPAEEIFRRVVDYEADAAERLATEQNLLTTKLKRWFSGNTP